MKSRLPLDPPLRPKARLIELRCRSDAWRLRARRCCAAVELDPRTRVLGIDARCATAYFDASCASRNAAARVPGSTPPRSSRLQGRPHAVHQEEAC